MNEQRLHVVAAVIDDPKLGILLARRPPHVHQGDLWEFPGGKVESDEDPLKALRRELQEELDILLESAHPLIQIRHDYPDKSVLLDVWRAENWHGTPWGREGQAIEWVRPERLGDYPFPAANQPVIKAAQLPSHYWITPDPDENFLPRLEQALQAGVRLIQLRAYDTRTEAYKEWARQALALCERYQAHLLLNADPLTVRANRAHGIHLNSQHLHQVHRLDLQHIGLIGASCHNRADLQRAKELGADFALLSPVRATQSHPDTVPLGWRQFAAWVADSRLPVYALGGMSPRYLNCAWAHGAQGIAGIRRLLD